MLEGLKPGRIYGTRKTTTGRPFLAGVDASDPADADGAGRWKTSRIASLKVYRPFSFGQFPAFGALCLCASFPIF